MLSREDIELSLVSRLSANIWTAMSVAETAGFREVQKNMVSIMHDAMNKYDEHQAELADL